MEKVYLGLEMQNLLATILPLRAARIDFDHVRGEHFQAGQPNIAHRLPILFHCGGALELTRIKVKYEKALKCYSVFEVQFPMNKGSDSDRSDVR